MTNSAVPFFEIWAPPLPVPELWTTAMVGTGAAACAKIHAGGSRWSGHKEGGGKRWPRQVFATFPLLPFDSSWHLYQRSKRQNACMTRVLSIEVKICIFNVWMSSMKWLWYCKKCAFELIFIFFLGTSGQNIPKRWLVPREIRKLGHLYSKSRYAAIVGSFHAKSSRGFNQVDFDSNETWCTCWWRCHSAKSEILGQLEWGGPPNMV